MVKIKHIDFGYNKMKRKLAELNGKKIAVGYPQPSKEGAIALVHEFGAVIPVTDKMRGFFAARGVHLSPQKTHIVIPERSFLRAGFDKHQKEVLDQAIKALDRTIFGNMSVQDFCDLYGLLMTGKLQDYAINLRTPPNAALTVMWKGSDNPLVDHGKMIRAITWEVK